MKCPHCKENVTIADVDMQRCATSIHRVYKHEKGKRYYAINCIICRCPNSSCGDIFVFLELAGGNQGKSSSVERIDYLDHQVVLNKMIYPTIDIELPEIPEYVPVQIRSDIHEACKIKKLSPKASATLIRRALQGMIRDFWNVKEKTLFKEIEGIKDKVDSLTWEAIDAVRKIGNIGAHMENDVDKIIDIDDNEADILIHLTLDLIEDWYVSRNNRVLRREEIKRLAESKKQSK